MPLMDFKNGDPAPKRGDLVQTNVGDRRERTWLVLKVRRAHRKRDDLRRYGVWMARWWELEPETRIRLWRSSQRAGGQRVIIFKRYPAKRNKSFENYMRRSEELA